MNKYSVEKTATKNEQPTEIRKFGARELKITWSDGHASVYPFRYLRQICPCASCVDEMSGKQVLDKDSVAQNLEGLKVDQIGHYALRFEFSDGHNTGLYPFRLLRRNCPCDPCKS